MGEDEGERGHQMGALNESRSKSLRDNAAKATAHAAWEEMDKDPRVVVHKEKVVEKSKRKRNILERLPQRDFSVWSIGNQWSKDKDHWAYPPIKITARKKKASEST